MSQYLIAIGHDVALEELDAIAPQPGSQGVQAARRTYAADGSLHEENLYIELAFGEHPVATYQSLLAQFGLDAASVVAVTLYGPGPDFEFARWNGYAVLPEIGRDVRRRGYFVDITILVRGLEEIEE